MKPIIRVFVSSNPNEITLTTEELQELIDTAYDEGYKEGRADCSTRTPIHTSITGSSDHSASLYTSRYKDEDYNPYIAATKKGELK